ncbi:MAG: hypothetical protein ACI8V2_004153 [Candidatus Latescibacterota bacterium]|jgi:hypothetical protein
MKRMFLLLGLMLFVGCSTERDRASLFAPEEVGVLVVDALLIVDKPLPNLFVRETVTPDGIYFRDQAGVTDAEVVIAHNGEQYLYRHSPDSLGYYLPPENAPLVVSGNAYALTVKSQGRVLTAMTTTPERIDIRDAVLLDDETLQVIRQFKRYEDGEDVVFSAPENQVPYQLGLLEARFEPLPVDGYHISIESLDLDSERVLESDLLDEQDYADLDRFGSSPAFEAHDGNLRLPWFAVAFAGRHVIRIYAVDRNWFDLIRSVPQFLGDDGSLQPGGLAGDSFERPLFHVGGGIGIFGSASMDSLGFVVLPKLATE